MCKIYRNLSRNLDSVVKTLDNDDFNFLKTECPDKSHYLNKKLAYLFEFFNSYDDYQKPVSDIKKEDFFSKIKNKFPDDKEIERTKEISQILDIKNGEQLLHLYLKSDIFLIDVFQKFIKVSIEEFDINLLYCVSLPGYTWQYGLKYTDNKLQTLQDKDLVLTI